MEVLILSKTKYGEAQVCIGGICIKNKQFIRLLNQGGHYQPADTQFNVGDIWDITFTVNPNWIEPHNEDVTIHTYKFIRKINLIETYIKNMGVQIWRNSILNVFEGKILWQKNGKGYFSEKIKNYPSHSVGFWISDVDLIYSNGYYFYENNGISKQIVYKGNKTALEVIPQGRLIRLSLAKWWKPTSIDIEARCFLQLSGWYEDKPEPINKIETKPIKSINPFDSIFHNHEPLNKTETKPIKSINPFDSIFHNHEPLNKTETKHIEKSQPSEPTFELIANKHKIQTHKNFKHKTPNYKTTKPIHQHKNQNGSCYIATLCYGDYYADEVCSFRDFRDATLTKTKLGRLFIVKYYNFAPKLTSKLKNHKALNQVIKYFILNPILAIIKTLNLDKK